MRVPVDHNIFVYIFIVFVCARACVRACVCVYQGRYVRVSEDHKPDRHLFAKVLYTDLNIVNVLGTEFSEVFLLCQA